MMDLLNFTLDFKIPDNIEGEEKYFKWRWLGIGIIEFTPKVKYNKSIILSAGIHGNETAPIEILNLIYQDLFNNKIELKQRILLILGHPLAIKAGIRYLENDINRMFCGKYHQLTQDQETQRAAQLEQIVLEFYQSSPVGSKRYHYDLHTAIRASLLPTFALLPYQSHSYDKEMLQSLAAAELDAVVYHSENGATFTHFSSSACQAASVTLELGKAQAFGQNNLNDFASIHQVLCDLITHQALPLRKKEKIQSFEVVSSILKQQDDFQLHVTDNAPNFISFAPNHIIYTQAGQAQSFDQEIYILFANPKVKKGLRAGLILIKKD